MNREAFFQALIDNVASRLEGTVASGARHESDKDELRNLLLDIDAVDPSKWPSGVESPWSQGEQRVRTLCDRFKIQFSSKLVADYRDYIDDPTTLP